MHPKQEEALERHKPFLNSTVFPYAIALHKGGTPKQETRNVIDAWKRKEARKDIGDVVGGLAELYLTGKLQDYGYEVLGLVATEMHAKNVRALNRVAHAAGIEVKTFSQNTVRSALEAVSKKTPSASEGDFLAEALGQQSEVKKELHSLQEEIDILNAWLKRKAGGDADVARERDQAVRLQQELLAAFTPSGAVEELRARAKDLRAQAEKKCKEDGMEAAIAGEVDRVRAIYAEADALKRDAEHLDHQAAEKEVAEKEAFALEQERRRQENLAAAQTNPVVKADPNAKGNGNGVVDPVKTRERIELLKAEEVRLVQFASEAYDLAQGVIDSSGLSVKKMTPEMKKKLSEAVTVGMRAEESADKAKAEVTTLEKLLAARPQPRKERQPKKASQPKPAAPKGGGLQEQQSALVTKILEAAEAGNDALVGNLTRALELIGGAMPTSASVH